MVYWPMGNSNPTLNSIVTKIKETCRRVRTGPSAIHADYRQRRGIFGHFPPALPILAESEGYKPADFDRRIDISEERAGE
jgi:hypothetical protein